MNLPVVEAFSDEVTRTQVLVSLIDCLHRKDLLPVDLNTILGILITLGCVWDVSVQRASICIAQSTLLNDM